MALCLLLAWIIVFLCLCKGVQSSGKVSAGDTGLLKHISSCYVIYAFIVSLISAHFKRRSVKLENYPSQMTEKSEVVLQKHSVIEKCNKSEYQN
jgi:hypothetical protein